MLWVSLVPRSFLIWVGLFPSAFILWISLVSRPFLLWVGLVLRPFLLWLSLVPGYWLLVSLVPVPSCFGLVWFPGSSCCRLVWYPDPSCYGVVCSPGSSSCRLVWSSDRYYVLIWVSVVPVPLLSIRQVPRHFLIWVCLVLRAFLLWDSLFQSQDMHCGLVWFQGSSGRAQICAVLQPNKTRSVSVFGVM